MANLGPDNEEEYATDDAHGEALDVAKVKAARAEEMAYIKGLPLYEYATIEEAIRTSGKPPIGVRWVDTNKLDRYRSRLVAMEFRTRPAATMFAGTPPSECLRMLCAIMTTGKQKKKAMKVIDVKKAHFQAEPRRPVYIKLPQDNERYG